MLITNLRYDMRSIINDIVKWRSLSVLKFACAVYKTGI